MKARLALPLVLALFGVACGSGSSADDAGAAGSGAGSAGAGGSTAGRGGGGGAGSTAGGGGAGGASAGAGGRGGTAGTSGGGTWSCQDDTANMTCACTQAAGGPLSACPTTYNCCVQFMAGASSPGCACTTLSAVDCTTFAVALQGTKVAGCPP